MSTNLIRTLSPWASCRRRQRGDESHRKVDKPLIRTAAGHAGIGNNDGHIAGSAPTVTGRVNPIRGHAVVTDTNPRQSPGTAL